MPQARSPQQAARATCGTGSSSLSAPSTPAPPPSGWNSSLRSRAPARCPHDPKAVRAQNCHRFGRKRHEGVTDTAPIRRYRLRRGRRDDPPPLGGGPVGLGLPGHGSRGRGLMGRFRDALAAPGLTGIAEVKRRSPSAGDLRPGADPAALAAAFERAGAAAVSILVDERFAGSLDDLRSARAATTLPLLGKGIFSLE